MYVLVLAFRCWHYPVSILLKSVSDCYRPIRIPDVPITVWCRFKWNASLVSLSSVDSVFMVKFSVYSEFYGFTPYVYNLFVDRPRLIFS